MQEQQHGIPNRVAANLDPLSYPVDFDITGDVDGGGGHRQSRRDERELCDSVDQNRLSALATKQQPRPRAHSGIGEFGRVHSSG